MTASAAKLVVLALLAGSPGADRGSITIEVSDGGTKVQNKGTSFVSVTPNEGKPQALGPGTSYDSASPPDQAQAQPRALRAPTLLWPGDKEKVKVKATDKGLSPVVLTWAPVAGAKEYEIEVQVGDAGQPRLFKVLQVPRPELKLTPQSPGKVLWAVRSVTDGATSEPARRSFELLSDLKLDARPGAWK